MKRRDVTLGNGSGFRREKGGMGREVSLVTRSSYVRVDQGR